MGKQMKIEITIERLILEGFTASDRHAIGEAVIAEITRILGEWGIPADWQQSAEISRLDAGNISLTSPNPAAIGGKIAQAIIASAQHATRNTSNS